MKDKVKVLYLCDHRACKVCSNPGKLAEGCNHTHKIKHAVNFENKTGVMVEAVKQ